MAAAGKWKLYDLAKKYLADGTHDLDDATNWKMALFQSTSNANTLSVGTAIYGDLTNEVAQASGYTTGGVAIGSETWVNASGTITWTCANGVWTASGALAARFAVIYRNATVNTIVKPLLAVCLLDTTPADFAVANGQQLIVSIPAGGVFTLSGATVD
jgi:GH18 family chitinase